MHQWCKMTNGLPVCQCEEKCKDVDIPLCGRVNGVQYKNPCELRKAECKTQEQIGANFGQCQSKFYIDIYLTIALSLKSDLFCI